MTKYPTILQSDIKDCGVASLLMIIMYYGGNIPREYLRNLLNVNNDGVSLYDIIKVSNNFGFDSKAVESSIDKLKKYLPCIAHVLIKNKYYHYIVVYKITNKYLIIADPSIGLKKIKIEEFNNITTNKFILLKPIKEIPFIKEDNNLFTLILNIINDNIKLIIFICLLSIIVSIINIFMSYKLQIFIKLIINTLSLENLFTITLLFLLIIIIKEIISFYRIKIINFWNHLIDKKLIKHVYNQLLSLPYLYYKNRTTGELFSRINDLSIIKEVVSNIILIITVDIILSLFILFFLIKINLELTLFILVLVFIYILIYLVFRNLIKRKIILNKECHEDVNKFLIESIHGIESIKNLEVEEIKKEEFDFKYNKFSNSIYEYNVLKSREDLSKNLANSIFILFIISYSSYLIIKNRFDLSNMITYYSIFFIFDRAD